MRLRVVALYLPASIFLAGVVVAWTNYGVAPGFLTRDPTATMDVSPYIGMVSSVGVLLWCAATALFLFASSLVWKGASDGLAGFLLYFGLFSLLLTLDDLFLIHEEFVYHQLDLSEKLMPTIYLIMLLVGGWAFRKQIRETDFGLLLVAAFFLALSAIIDKYWNVFQDDELRILLEDGFKFFGIVGWFGYAWNTAYAQVARRLTSR